MFKFKTACGLIWLLCHKVIYYPWSCVFLDTLQCHSSWFLVDFMVIHKVNTSGSLQQSCSATSTHPLASRRSNTAASTFSWPSIRVVKHYSLYKHWAWVKREACKSSMRCKELPENVLMCVYVCTKEEYQTNLLNAIHVDKVRLCNASL